MLFESRVITHSSKEDFENWKAQYQKEYKPMRSRAIIDLKNKNPKLVWAVRVAPNGSHEEVQQRELDGFLRFSRTSSPTIRTYETRMITSVGIAMGFTMSRAGDISRAYPKSRGYDDKDFKFMEFPSNMVKSEARRNAMRFKEGFVLKILRPLYGTQDAGRDFSSNLSFDMVHQFQMQNSVISPCVYSDVGSRQLQPPLQKVDKYTRH